MGCRNNCTNVRGMTWTLALQRRGFRSVSALASRKPLAPIVQCHRVEETGRHGALPIL